MRKLMMRTLYLSVIAVCAMTHGSGQAEAGPLSDYYITNGDSGSMKVVNGNSIVNSWALRDNTYPIAVTTTVDAYSTYSFNTGSQYTLGGTYTGTDFPFQGDPGQSLDGTTDGTSHDWLVSFNDNGVYQFDLNWQNPVLAFTIPTSPTGITYDQITGTLWVASDAGVIEQYTTGGVMLSSFLYGDGRLGSLAWEPLTNTLWGVINGTDEIRQFSMTGTLLESDLIPGLAGNNWGGEFALAASTAVPEPSTFALLGLGGVGLTISAYRRRQLAA